MGPAPPHVSVFNKLAISCGTLTLLLCPCRSPGQISRVSGQTGSYKLSGSVVNSATGEFIPRALVQVSGSVNQAVLTTPEGSFEFTNLPAGQVAVMVSKPGFFPQSSPQTNGSQAPAVVPTLVQIGPDIPPLSLPLVPQAIIRGRVEAEGEPVEALQIRVYASALEDGRRHWEQRGAAHTDDDGTFRVANLAPGIYYLVAGPGAANAGDASGAFVPDNSYPETFYPGTTEISGATPIELTAGQQAELFLPLSKSPLFQVSGTVAGAPTGQTPMLQLADWAGEEVSLPARWDAPGRFRIALHAGSYTLGAAAPAGDGSPLAARTALTVNSDLANVRLTLSPLATIPVKVRSEAANGPGQPGSGPIRSRAIFPSVSVRLVSTTDSRDFFANLGGNTGAPSLSFNDVTPGKYAVKIDAGNSWYVQSAMCGAADLLREDLMVTTGGSLTPIEIVLRNDGATVKGTLSSEGRPAAGSVLLVPDFAPRQVKIAAGSEDGTFQVSSLAPGDYTVLAFDQIGSLEYANPDILNGYLSKGNHVSLSPNASLNLNPPLLHLGN